MAGIIVADTIQSDQSYPSSINIASPMVVSNTINMTNGNISGNVNFDSGTLFVDSVGNRVGVGTNLPLTRLHVQQSVTAGEARVLIHNSSGSSGDTSALFLSAVGSQGFELNRAAALKSTIGPSNEHSLSFFTNPAFDSPVERMKIDSAGRVTKPNQPAFCAFLSQSTQSYSGQGIRKIDLNSVDFNIGNHFNTSTGRFTAPVTGTYMFSAVVAAETTTNTWAFLSAEIWKNGSRLVHSGWNSKTSGSNVYENNTGTYVVRLNANDYIELGFEVSGTISLLGTYLYGTKLFGYLIG